MKVSLRQTYWLVNFDVMKLVWYSNSAMPDGKSLEFQDNDRFVFDCEEVNF
jgi:hypothetical protein